MADEFTCNSCGKLSDTGYFYCEKCHRMHKERKQKDKDKNNSDNEVLDIFKSDLESSSKAVIRPDLKVKPS